MFLNSLADKVIEFVSSIVLVASLLMKLRTHVKILVQNNILQMIRLGNVSENVHSTDSLTTILIIVFRHVHKIMEPLVILMQKVDNASVNVPKVLLLTQPTTDNADLIVCHHFIRKILLIHVKPTVSQVSLTKEHNNALKYVQQAIMVSNMFVTNINVQSPLPQCLRMMKITYVT
jgi:hypothetical protein